MNSYKGVSLFNDVESRKLQAWNRVAAMLNFVGTHGEQEASNYTNHFDDTAKRAMKATGALIKDMGYAAARKTINV
tara:strand:- start:24697 stop:24924 length:228 start_codon:yes stop_codon:yes gene_type:complete